MMAATIKWLAADWGTSNLRVWGMDATGTAIWQRSSADGMGTLDKAGFEPALKRLIGDDMPDTTLPVMICGMAGSRQGWVEAPYATAPCHAPGVANATRVATQDPRLQVCILPGVKQDTPPDVMRGEETQIAGFLASDPDFDGVVCLPGTHTKWVRISAKEIVSFQTFMTGEMFDLLSNHSVLRHGLGSGWDATAFETAVSDVMSRPAAIASHLFAIRSAGLVADVAPETARARLSGLLIGAELAGARPYWLGQRIAILGDEKLGQLYADALAAQGAISERTDVTNLTLDGLRAAMAGLTELI